jgi:hypothetical protein
MNATATFAIVSGNGQTARFRTQPRVEKTSASNAPYGERRDNSAQTITLSPVPPCAGLSQIETAAYEPDWNGPRLTAPFVAQVLGQALTTESGETRSALSAYRGEAQVFSALLCDRRV